MYLQPGPRPEILHLLTFHSPKTLELSRAPKYPRKSIPHAPRMDASTILIHPLNTESAMKKVNGTTLRQSGPRADTVTD
jgi:hypothetical protein